MPQPVPLQVDHPGGIDVWFVLNIHAWLYVYGFKYQGWYRKEYPVHLRIQKDIVRKHNYRL